MRYPLVSVVVTTKNNADTIASCLESIGEQNYPNVEIILVDNSSSDRTTSIASKYTKKIYNFGPERSAQRNYGVEASSGEYVLIVDSDMELSKRVISSCVEEVNSEVNSVIIPEMSFGEGYWSQCKALERSFYNDIAWIEAPRFFSRTVLQQVGGYDENIVGGEDWDLRVRIEKVTRIEHILASIRHNEGRLSLLGIASKRLYYSGGYSEFYVKDSSYVRSKAAQVLGTYWLFLKQPGKLFRNPKIGIGVIMIKSIEFGAIGTAIIKTKLLSE